MYQNRLNSTGYCTANRQAGDLQRRKDARNAIMANREAGRTSRGGVGIRFRMFFQK
jgi:hypothetical protein